MTLESVTAFAAAIVEGAQRRELSLLAQVNKKQRLAPQVELGEVTKAQALEALRTMENQRFEVERTALAIMYFTNPFTENSIYSMDEKQLEILRINARIVAVESLLAMLLTSWTRTPDAREMLLETLSRFPESLNLMAFPDRSPEEADLISAEMRDAAENLVSFVKSNLSK